jgi:hypothetical protein
VEGYPSAGCRPKFRLKAECEPAVFGYTRTDLDKRLERYHQATYRKVREQTDPPASALAAQGDNHRGRECVNPVTGWNSFVYRNRATRLEKGPDTCQLRKSDPITTS